MHCSQKNTYIKKQKTKTQKAKGDSESYTDVM